MTTSLRAALDSVADADVPLGLGQRALEVARRRRRHRLTTVGVTVLAAVLVVGAGSVLRPAADHRQPKPDDVASIPLSLPDPEQLPTLADAPMGIASVAYVAAGELVLVSGADAHAVTVPVDGSGLRAGAVEVALSPDGRWAVVVREWAPTVDAAGLPLSLLDVAAGREVPLDGVWLGRPVAGSGWLQPQLVAWSPDAGWFACTCASGAGSPTVQLVERTDAADGSIEHASALAVEAAGLSWGAMGLAVRESPDGGRWVLVPYHQLPGGHGGPPGWPVLADHAAALVVSPDYRDGFLSAGPGWYELASAYGGRLPGSLGGDRLAFLAQAREGYLLGTLGPGTAAGEPPAAGPVYVRGLTYLGQPRDLTLLPAGTSSASFAGGLVHVHGG